MYRRVSACTGVYRFQTKRLIVERPFDNQTADTNITDTTTREHAILLKHVYNNVLKQIQLNITCSANLTNSSFKYFIIAPLKNSSSNRKQKTMPLHRNLSISNVIPEPQTRTPTRDIPRLCPSSRSTTDQTARGTSPVLLRARPVRVTTTSDNTGTRVL